MNDPRPSPEMQEENPVGRDPGPRPTPARVVMEGPSEGGSGAGPQRRTFRDPSMGREWVLSIVGRSTSGVLPLRTIRLMEVQFAPAEGSEGPCRTVVSRDTDLAELSEDEVLGLFRLSRVHREPDPKARLARPGEGRGGGRRGPGG